MRIYEPYPSPRSSCVRPPRGNICMHIYISCWPARVCVYASACLHGKYEYWYYWGRPINGISLNIWGYHSIYRLEDIPYSGVICNIISYFFLRSAYSPCRSAWLGLRVQPATSIYLWSPPPPPPPPPPLPPLPPPPPPPPFFFSYLNYKLSTSRYYIKQYHYV